MVKKSQAWFYKVRGSYLPKNTKGWLTYIPYVIYLIGVPALEIIFVINLVAKIILIVISLLSALIMMTLLAKIKS